MPAWLVEICIALAVSLATIWLLLAVAFLWLRPDRESLKDAARLPVDVLRLVRNLLRQEDLPRGARVRLWLLLGYLVFPIDIVPDFIPVIGYADDVIVTSFLLRGIVRATGFDALERNWTGSPDGLRAIAKLCGIASS